MSYARRAELADMARLLGLDMPEPWVCPKHNTVLPEITFACNCPPPQPLERCHEHGDYQPRGMDASCPTCEARNERQDAHHDWRWQLDHNDQHRYSN